jgi:hypothetical protein
MKTVWLWALLSMEAFLLRQGNYFTLAVPLHPVVFQMNVETQI